VFKCDENGVIVDGKIKIKNESTIAGWNVTNDAIKTT
jgi:hypothetical protein